MSLLNEALKNLEKSKQKNTYIVPQRHVDLSWLSDYHLFKITLLILLLCTLAYNITAQLKQPQVAKISPPTPALQQSQTNKIPPDKTQKKASAVTPIRILQPPKSAKITTLVATNTAPKTILPVNPRLSQLQKITVESGSIIIRLTWLPQYKLQQVRSGRWQLTLQNSETKLLTQPPPVHLQQQGNNIVIQLPEAEQYSITSRLSDTNLAILSLSADSEVLATKSEPTIGTKKQPQADTSQTLLVLLKNRQYQQATDYFVNHSDHSHIRSQQLAARAYYQLGQHKKVVATLNISNLSIEENPHYFALRSLSMVELGNFPEAKIILQRVVKIIPDNSQYWIAFGLALDGVNNRQGAIEALLTALTAKPIDAPLQDYVQKKLLRWGVLI